MRALIHNLTGRTLNARFQRTLALTVLPIALVALAAFVSLRINAASFEKAAAEQSDYVIPLLRLTAHMRAADDLAYDAYERRSPVAAFDRGARQVRADLARMIAQPDANAGQRRDLRLALSEWDDMVGALHVLVATPGARTDSADDAMEVVATLLRGAASATERAQASAIRGTRAALEHARTSRVRGHRVSLAMALLGLLIAVYVGHRLARSVLAPVRVLEQGARRLGTGDLSYRVTVDADDELGELARSFNGMAEALEQKERELLESQDRLMQAKRLEAVGQLAGGVAHDFNNLLTAILGHGELLLADDAVTPGQEHSLRQIKGAAERAGELTYQLLAYGRRQALEPRVLDLNAIVEESAGLIDRILGDHIELRVTLAPSPLYVEADPAQLQRVILNLAANARDSLVDGGVLAIESRSSDEAPAEVGAAGGVLAPGPYAVLEITDTGIGMDHATIERIFEPFFTTKPTGAGSGLGLASVHGIVAQSRGEITVRSDPARGTTFTVWLAQVDAPAVEVATPGPAVRREASELVLLVDDTDVVRSLLRSILELAGHDVLEARDGVEALALFEAAEVRPRVVLTDIVMPAMGGIELGRRIGEISPETVVVYMSGFSDESVNGTLPAGATFLAKPFTRQSLEDAIAVALDDRPSDGVIAA
jgi:signal transduction histidine kinase/ActR/RegA family two-component response regulator